MESLEGLDEEDYEWFEALLRVQSRRRKILVAELHGEVIGFAIAYKYRNTAYIDSVAVKSGYRGFGIGGKLLSELERVLIEAGAESAALSVKDGNKKALDFYLRKGYALKGVILIMRADVNVLPDSFPNHFTLKRKRAGSLGRVRSFKAATWWSTLTEPVDRLIYKRYLRDEEALLAYKGNRLKGLVEFTLDHELFADYMALASYQAVGVLQTLLSGLKNVSLEAGAEVVTAPVDASKRKIVEALLANGFKTISAEYLAVKEFPEQ